MDKKAGTGTCMKSHSMPYTQIKPSTDVNWFFNMTNRSLPRLVYKIAPLMLHFM